jgi:hypothetical protein
MKEVKKPNNTPTAQPPLLEEGVIRREPSDNFVYYSPNDHDLLRLRWMGQRDTDDARP